MYLRMPATVLRPANLLPPQGGGRRTGELSRVSLSSGARASTHLCWTTCESAGKSLRHTPEGLWTSCWECEYHPRIPGYVLNLQQAFDVADGYTRAWPGLCALVRATSHTPRHASCNKIMALGSACVDPFDSGPCVFPHAASDFVAEQHRLPHRTILVMGAGAELSRHHGGHPCLRPDRS